MPFDDDEDETLDRDNFMFTSEEQEFLKKPRRRYEA
jgi:hypothetical protein